MKRAAATMLGLVSALLTAAPAPAQGPAPGPACAAPTAAGAPGCGSSGGAPHGLCWTAGCFPRQGWPDDYCPTPCPRPCWPPYPPFYRCVPAGDCAPPACGGNGGGWHDFTGAERVITGNPAALTGGQAVAVTP
jgi:hypothetical protein